MQGSKGHALMGDIKGRSELQRMQTAFQFTEGMRLEGVNSKEDTCFLGRTYMKRQTSGIHCHFNHIS